METKILLCDDHKIFREGLKTLIASDRSLRVVGEAADGNDAVSLAASLHPNLIIMDISMPGLNGIEATRKIIAAHKGLKIIVLSMHSDRRFVSEALRAGAKAYLLKDSAFEELSAAIRSVCAGKTYLDPAVATAVVDDYVGRLSEREKSAFTQLSDREREILQLVAEGRSTKEIATALKLSIKTVDTHRNRIMEKLQIDSVAGLTKYAVREGLTTL
jgi:DNA-binding NarL/FixJ family response regulator